ncbi:hypothetical protein [Paraburkholderia sp. SIMBA_030]|uniref:hypothetical protein n=1 Tax=Paraburkholderia sp. SIMBA_030 TaxID=3085773 RepID=UPI00397A4F98
MTDREKRKRHRESTRVLAAMPYVYAAHGAWSTTALLSIALWRNRWRFNRRMPQQITPSSSRPPSQLYQRDAGQVFHHESIRE